MTGKIKNIENCGTIVVVWIGTTPVYFDHRCFRHLLKAENCNAADLIGRPARFNGESLFFEE